MDITGAGFVSDVRPEAPAARGNAEAACIGGAKEELRERCERVRESRGGRNREARLPSGETGLTGGEG